LVRGAYALVCGREALPHLNFHQTMELAGPSTRFPSVVIHHAIVGSLTQIGIARL
jgi:hypothetical protein